MASREDASSANWCSLSQTDSNSENEKSVKTQSLDSVD